MSRRHRPLLISLVALWGCVAVLLFLSVRANQGRLVYALDDAYIHMSIARNLVEHRVWGVTRHEFSSASSSPGWTLLLWLCFSIFGVHESIPFWLNLGVASVGLVALGALLSSRSDRLGERWQAAILLAVTFLTPLPVLIHVGMEHTASAVVSVAFVVLISRELARGGLGRPDEPNEGPHTSHDAARPGRGARDAVRPRWRTAAVLVLTLTLVLLRYEGLFLVAVAWALLMLRRRCVVACLMGATALAPVVAYGVCSVAHGSAWLPNSILLKGNLADLEESGAALRGLASADSRASSIASALRRLAQAAGYTAYRNLVTTPHMLVLLTAALLLYLTRADRGPWEEGQVAGLIFIGSALLHLQFARLGWFYRYEAYLVAVGLVVLLPQLAELMPALGARLSAPASPVASGAVLAVLVALASVPLVARGAVGIATVPAATSVIFEQQYQMGLFLKRHYGSATVAVNDLGATTFLADVKVLDLGGLGSIEICRLMRAGPLRREDLEALCRARAVEIAIVYDTRPDSEGTGWMPRDWCRVGVWTIPKKMSIGPIVVSFHAGDRSRVATAIRRLKEFSTSLPAAVIQRGAYLDGGPGGPDRGAGR